MLSHAYLAVNQLTINRLSNGCPKFLFLCTFLIHRNMILGVEREETKRMSGISIDPFELEDKRLAVCTTIRC